VRLAVLFIWAVFSDQIRCTHLVSLPLPIFLCTVSCHCFCLTDVVFILAVASLVLYLSASLSSALLILSYLAPLLAVTLLMGPPVLIRPHYGATFRVDLVDAAKETVVGSAVIPVQTLLQYQRDEQVMASNSLSIRSLLSFKSTSGSGSRQMSLELRVSDTESKVLDWYPLIKTTDQVQQFGKLLWKWRSAV
jgi:hypothetical protein